MPKKLNFLGGQQNYDADNGQYLPDLTNAQGESVKGFKNFKKSDEEKNAFDEYNDKRMGKEKPTESNNDSEELKDKQLKIILENNPMRDSYHTGIRDISDIKTFAEVIDDDESFVYGDFSREDAKKALEKGKITVYSSKPISQGGFVSTSRNMARDYAGGGKIYEQEVDLDSVAWINGDEGQFADTKAEKPTEKPQEKAKDENVGKTIKVTPYVNTYGKWGDGEPIRAKQLPNGMAMETKAHKKYSLGYRFDGGKWVKDDSKEYTIYDIESGLPCARADNYEDALKKAQDQEFLKKLEDGRKYYWEKHPERKKDKTESVDYNTKRMGK